MIALASTPEVAIVAAFTTAAAVLNVVAVLSRRNRP